MPLRKTIFKLIIAVVFALALPTQALAQVLTNFEFNNFTAGSSKMAGIPFEVKITAKDNNGQTMSSFNGTASLLDSTGTLWPTQTSNFTNGIWIGNVYITKAQNDITLTATSGQVSDNSDTFTVVPDTRIKFLTPISGNNQAASVGNQLPNSFVVRVVDPYANAIPNIGVNFAVAVSPFGTTNYSLSNTSGITNSLGNAATSLTFGNRAGNYVVTAGLNVGLAHQTSFYATALPGTIYSLTIIPSIAVVPTGGFLPFTAKGLDQFGNEVSLSQVTWSVQNGGGTIDSTGIFRAGQTLGTYSNTIKALSGVLGSTASVSIVSGSGEAGGDATGSGIAQPTPIPTLTPTPTIPAQGVLYDVQVDPAVISALRNARIPIVAEGVDIFGNVVSGVLYEFGVEGDLGTITQTGPNTAVLTVGESGLGSVVVTATQGSVTSTARIAGSVGNGMNRRLVIEDIQSPQFVGEPFTISIAAKDSANNFITDYEGPIVMADSTGTLDPAVVQPSETGIWYVQAVVKLAHPEVSITVAGDGMVGVSNIFEVQGNPNKDDMLPFGSLGGAGEILGASVSALLSKLIDAGDLGRFGAFRYIGSGLAAGFGILGTSIGGGIMVSRGLEAVGRNPYAKGKLQFNLYASMAAFVAVAGLAVLAALLILR